MDTFKLENVVECLHYAFKHRSLTMLKQIVIPQFDTVSWMFSGILQNSRYVGYLFLRQSNEQASNGFNNIFNIVYLIVMKMSFCIKKQEFLLNDKSLSVIFLEGRF